METNTALVISQLVMEGVKARQLRDVLHSEVHIINKKLQCANSFLDLFSQKAARFDDQVTIACQNLSMNHIISLGVN